MKVNKQTGMIGSIGIYRKSKRGGKREGSGRPKGRDTVTGIRVYVDDLARYRAGLRMSGLSSAEYFRRIWIDFCTVTRE